VELTEGKHHWEVELLSERDVEVLRWDSLFVILVSYIYGWMPHNAGFGVLDLTPSILLLRQFWD
jgi:hypothetical protein